MINYSKNVLLLSILFLSLVLGFTQCTKSIENQLKEIAEKANEQCPKNLDQWTRLDSCKSFADKSYTYYHTISGIVVSDTTLFKSKFESEIIKTVKIHPDMRFFRDNGITLNYRYGDESSNYLFTISLTAERYK